MRRGVLHKLVLGFTTFASVSYVALLTLVLILLIALMWDMWIPSSVASARRPGTTSVALTLLFSSAALVAMLLSASAYLVAVALAISALSCIPPFRIVVAYAKKERGRAKHSPKTIVQRGYVLPDSLVDADNALKLQYDDVIRRFEAASPLEASPALVEQGRQLAEALHNTARDFGYSKAYEMSQEIPALTYWAAEVARRSYPAGHERVSIHEDSLRYYKNFESTAWLWDRYKQGAK
jgi:hypothetical protein